MESFHMTLKARYHMTCEFINKDLRTGQDEAKDHGSALLFLERPPPPKLHNMIIFLLGGVRLGVRVQVERDRPRKKLLGLAERAKKGTFAAHNSQPNTCFF